MSVGEVNVVKGPNFGGLHHTCSRAVVMQEVELSFLANLKRVAIFFNC
jgi:hypothetical protein